jgi:hypothetical protein
MSHLIVDVICAVGGFVFGLLSTSPFIAKIKADLKSAQADLAKLKVGK